MKRKYTFKNREAYCAMRKDIQNRPEIKQKKSIGQKNTMAKPDVREKHHKSIVDGYKNGRMAWNKGLTKETSEAVRKNSESTRQAIKELWQSGHYAKSVLGGNFKKTEDQIDKRKQLMNEGMAFDIVKTKNNISDMSDTEAIQKLIDITKEEFKKEGYIVEIDRYVKTKEYIDCICPNGHNWRVKLNDWRSGSRCRICAHLTSNQEREVYDFIKSLIPDAQNNARPAFMNGKELDIYVPEKNFAVEYNGLHWHTSQYVPKNQHKEKFLLCKQAGVKLFQIFSDEWENKKELVKKMIEYRLGRLDVMKIRASKCEICPVPKDEEKEFYNKYHLSGYTRSAYAWGLYNGTELVACLTFRKPYADRQKGTIEIARYANSYDYICHGAFAKLFAFAKKELTGKFERISTYSDCRLSWGEVYETNGFTFMGHTSPNYWYVVDDKREFRFGHRRTDKWNEFGKTEREQNENQGWFAIYDAGNYKWELGLT